MLSTDEIILNILSTAKNEGNQLLKHFQIKFPDKTVAEESNTIFIAVVSSENSEDGCDFISFRDLVEILIVTKNRDYRKGINIIKTVSREICRLIMLNKDKFPNKPVIRNVNPEFNSDFVLTRGHIMVQVTTNPESFDITDEECYICDVYLNELNEVIEIDK